MNEVQFPYFKQHSLVFTPWIMLARSAFTLHLKELSKLAIKYSSQGDVTTQGLHRWSLKGELWKIELENLGVTSFTVYETYSYRFLENLRRGTQTI